MTINNRLSGFVTGSGYRYRDYYYLDLVIGGFCVDLVFVSGGARRGEFGFCFHFGSGAGRWAIISWGLLIFRVLGRSATREPFGKSFGN